jgi:signal transduction histidine kinase
MGGKNPNSGKSQGWPMLESFLLQVSLFSSLEKEDRREIIKTLNHLRLRPNTILFREGDKGHHLYIVFKGEVEAVKGIGSSEEQVVQIIKPSEYFGEMCFFNPREIRAASIRARTEVDLLELEKSDFDELVLRRPAIVKVLARDLAVRFDQAEKHLIGALHKKNLQLKRQSRESLEKENLAATGRAVSALVHEIKTSLIAIGGFAQIVHRHLDGNSQDRDKLGIVISEIQRLEFMIKNMLDFARPLDLDKHATDISLLIEESVEISSASMLDSPARIETHVAVNLPPLHIDANWIKRVLINLLVNAAQASPKGGKVTVRCYMAEDDFLIEVTDWGRGIPADEKPKIFSPFFTTRKGGTGLGLPIAGKIIEAHRGSIEVLDNPEGGTIFRLRIPAR